MKLESVYFLERVKTTEFNGFKEAKVSALVEDGETAEQVLDQLEVIVMNKLNGTSPKTVQVATKANSEAPVEEKPKKAKAAPKAKKAKKEEVAVEVVEDKTMQEVTTALRDVAAKLKDASKAKALIKKATGKEMLAEVDQNGYNAIYKEAMVVLNG